MDGTAAALDVRLDISSEGWMAIHQVEQETLLHRASIYRKVAAGTFPAPVKMSERKSLWARLEIKKYVADRIAARDRPTVGG